MKEYLEALDEYEKSLDEDESMNEEESMNNLSLNVAFNSDGKIVHFPNVEFNSKPIMYVLFGKAVEEIISYEGDRIKNAYNKAIDIVKEYELQKDALKSKINNQIERVVNILSDKREEVEKTQDLEIKAHLQNEIYVLRKEEEHLRSNLPLIEMEVNRLDRKANRAISELTI